MALSPTVGDQKVSDPRESSDSPNGYGRHAHDLAFLLVALHGTVRRKGRLDIDDVHRVCHRLDFEQVQSVLAALEREGIHIEDAAERHMARGSSSTKANRPSLDDEVGLFLEGTLDGSPLTREEEMALARRVGWGNQAREKLGVDGDPAELQRWIHEGAEALRQLVEANLRLVPWRARHFLRLVPRDRVADVLQQGFLGLQRAAERFDPKRGARFSTYAQFWIFQSIQRFLEEHGRVVRLPSHVIHELSRLRRARHRLRVRYGLLGAGERAELAKELGLTETRVAFLEQVDEDVRSLDRPARDDETEMWEVVPDTTEPEPRVPVEEKELSAVIDRLLGGLKPREREILRLRFGLGGSEALTLEEIGVRYEVTRERIRQIEQKALARLRHPSQSRILEPFLEDVA